MASVPTGLASAVTCWWLVFTAMALLHRFEDDWCAMGGPANGTGPWGIATTGRHRLSQRRGYSSDTSIAGGDSAVASWHPNTRRHPILSAVTVLPLKQQQQQQNKQTGYQSMPTATGLPRGGGVPDVFRNRKSPFDNPPPPFVRTIGTVTQLLISAGKAVLPPLVGLVRGIVVFYRALPMDAIHAQIGLVYCFLGGYYPTLFSSLQAAKHCGWNVAVEAISDLTDEAIKVIDEIEDASMEWEDDNGFSYDYGYNNNNNNNNNNKRALFLRQTHIVLKTVDPAKINTAAGALYTTWLGISTILRREYARVINLALTLAEGLETALRILLAPALTLVVPPDYHRWVPVLLGWAAKAASMRLAWRIERVLTAATSAIAGGAMVARSLARILARYRDRAKREKLRSSTVAKASASGRDTQREERIRSVVLSKSIRDDNDGGDGGDDDNYEHDYEYDDDDDTKRSIGEQAVGFAIGGLGFYTQMESQYRQNFSFIVPFPMSLITFPFDLAERWIQWYITEH